MQGMRLKAALVLPFAQWRSKVGQQLRLAQSMTLVVTLRIHHVYIDLRAASVNRLSLSVFIHDDIVHEYIVQS
jgi:hypothetical protein